LNGSERQSCALSERYNQAACQSPAERFKTLSALRVFPDAESFPVPLGSGAHKEAPCVHKIWSFGPGGENQRAAVRS
jgi:hypothetical protein